MRTVLPAKKEPVSSAAMAGAETAVTAMVNAAMSMRSSAGITLAIPPTLPCKRVALEDVPVTSNHLLKRRNCI